MFRRTFLPALLLILVALTYCWRLGDKPLDFDERLTLNMTTGLCGTAYAERVTGTYQVNPLPQQPFTPADYWARFTPGNTLSAGMSDNGQGIPYMLALRTFLNATGVTVVHGRLLSVLFSLLAGTLLVGFLRAGAPQPVPRLTALAAAALLLLNGLFTDLSQYIRVYTLSVALAIASWFLLYLFQQKPTRLRAFALGLVWTVLFLNHYFAAPVILAQAIWLGCRGRKNIAPGRLALVAGSSGLTLLFWLFPLGGTEVISAIFRYHGHEVQDTAAWMPVQQPTQLATGFAASLATVFGQPTAFVPGIKTWINILLAIPAWAVCLRLWRAQLSDFERFLARVAVLALMVQLLLVCTHVLATGKALLLVSRYWVFCLPFTAVLLSLALQKAWQSSRRWQATALLAVLFLVLRMGVSTYTAWTGKRIVGFLQTECIPAAPYPDTEQLAADIRRAWQPGDTAVLKSWRLAQEVNWFLRDAPHLLQAIDSAQTAPVWLKTPTGSVAIPVHLGRPAVARPCR